VRELFIYYRSSPQHAEQVLKIVGDFQTGLRLQWPALEARLLRRPQLHSEHVTWMETYSMKDPLQHPAGIDAPVQRAIETAALALQTWIDGERHVEVFESCAC
jgi:hypothetical protein